MPFALKVKTKSNQEIIKTLTPDSTIKELKLLLSNLSNIPEDKLSVLSGFPPKQLDISDDTLRLCTAGVSSGDTLILEERVGPPVRALPVTESSVDAIQSAQLQSAGILMKHVVPADNSCLFTSVHYVLNGKDDETGSVVPWMRNLIAESVKGDTETYSEAILGKPNKDYCKWIQDDKSWGGAIEISILSNYYGIEIAVVDIVNAIINRFGEDKDYGNRVFLMFDGIHYDPLYLESLDGGGIRTMFPMDDEWILGEAEQLAREAKSSRQYTDVNKFTLRCLDCDVRLSGQEAAQKHAQTTGHRNFGEV